MSLTLLSPSSFFSDLRRADATTADLPFAVGHQSQFVQVGHREPAELGENLEGTLPSIFRACSVLPLWYGLVERRRNPLKEAT